MALRKEIRDAIGRDGKYVATKVWSIEVDEPDYRTSEQGMTIYVSVLKRKRRKSKNKILTGD